MEELSNAIRVCVFQRQRERVSIYSKEHSKLICIKRAVEHLGKYCMLRRTRSDNPKSFTIFHISIDPSFLVLHFSPRMSLLAA